MNAEERQQFIVRRIRIDGRVDVAVLSDRLGVAMETVRRDLRLLERRGLLRRVYGGAFPVEGAGYESTLTARTTRMMEEKQRIAGVAITLLGDADSVYLDEGYTTQLIAGILPAETKLTVVTASLPTAILLARNPLLTVLQTGGRVRGNTMGAVSGWTTRMLAEMVVDVAILGANGVSRERGMTTPDPAVAEVKRQAIRSSRRSVFVGDHTKFGTNSFCQFAEVRDFTTIVTDKGLSGTEAHRYEMLGVQVIRA